MTIIIARGRVLVTILSVLWIGLTVWYEYFRFAQDGKQCSWPDDKFLPPTKTVKPTHVLVIADPQILDHRSYPERSALLSWITRVMVKINMRKNWWVAKGMRPDMVVFLGDMLDGGRFDMSDAEYEAYVKRFNDIFQLDATVPKYFIPGNHDTGLGIEEWFSPERYTRYVKHFGDLNYEVRVANHSLVFVDAPGFADEEHKMKLAGMGFGQWTPKPGGALEFVTKYTNPNDDPTVLLSHIPLYRPGGNGCGPLRERGRIRPGGGAGYQNTLEKDGSQLLLETFHPTLILSGDDHDYCEYTHFIASSPSHPNPPNAKEISVKSFSMAMGVKRPGFHLLSLAPSALRNPKFGHKPNDDTPCFMPDQLGIYLRIYLPVGILTVVATFVANVCRCGSKRGRGRSLTRRSPSVDARDRRRMSPPPASPLTRRPGSPSAELEKGFASDLQREEQGGTRLL